MIIEELPESFQSLINDSYERDKIQKWFMENCAWMRLYCCSWLLHIEWWKQSDNWWSGLKQSLWSAANSCLQGKATLFWKTGYLTRWNYLLLDEIKNFRILNKTSISLSACLKLNVNKFLFTFILNFQIN